MPPKVTLVRFVIGGVTKEVEAAVLDPSAPQWPETLAQSVLTRAMKGVKAGKPKADQKAQEAFCKKFKPLADWIVARMPRGLSVAVGAAAFKAAIFYGLDSAGKFCVTMAKATFDGADDPAHLLWQQLQRNRGKEKARENYQRAVSAVRAYCEGRRIKSITVAATDIFEWEENLTVPSELDDKVNAILQQLLEEEEARKQSE